MRWIIDSTNLNGKARISMRVYRNGKWQGLGLWWNIREFFREFFIQITNIFRKEKKYATVLTQVGEEWIVDKLDEVVQTTGDWIGWGTGTGTASKDSTALFDEAPEPRVQAVRSQPTPDKIRWVGTLTASAPRTITNAGNFTHSTGGTLIVHGDFTGIPLQTGDRIEFTIEIEIT